jgi:hypothetical protein
MSLTGSPRIVQTQLETIHFQSTTRSLSFDLTSYPAPSQTFSFRFAGVNRTDTPREVEDVVLGANCLPKSGSVYQFTCTITVVNMTSPQADGYYVMSVSNTKGTHNFTFQVLYNHGESFVVCLQYCFECVGGGR